ncbi:hypothetical protein Q7P37_004806 [Cladosporium fusiforme]
MEATSSPKGTEKASFKAMNMPEIVENVLSKLSPRTMCVVSRVNSISNDTVKRHMRLGISHSRKIRDDDFIIPYHLVQSPADFGSTERLIEYSNIIHLCPMLHGSITLEMTILATLALFKMAPTNRENLKPAGVTKPQSHPHADMGREFDLYPFQLRKAQRSGKDRHIELRFERIWGDLDEDHRPQAMDDLPRQSIRLAGFSQPLFGEGDQIFRAPLASPYNPNASWTRMMISEIAIDMHIFVDGRKTFLERPNWKETVLLAADATAGNLFDILRRSLEMGGTH